MPRIDICGDIDNVPTLEHILKSNNCDNFLGITVLVATANDGYLYQFSNNGKIYFKKKTVFIHYLHNKFIDFICILYR